MRTPSERIKQGLPADGLPKRRPVKKDDPKSETPVPPSKPPHKTEGNGEAKDVSFAIIQTAGDLEDIWERRMLNPEQKQSEPIRIKRPGMHLRWINLAAHGRYQRARYEEGWEPVHKDQLVDEREIYGVSYTAAGEICRGERQTEMLMWMPEAIFKKIHARKQQKVIQSQRKIKESMVNYGASEMNKRGRPGDQAAEEIMAPRGTDGAFRGSVNFGTEAVEPDDDTLTAIQTEGAE